MVSKSEAVMSLTSMQPQNTLGMENLAYTSSSGEDASAVAMEIIAHPQQNLYNQVNNFNPQFVQVLNNHGSCEELYCFPTHSSVLERGHHHHQFPYSTPTPDLLSLLHLPMSFENPSTNVLKLSGPMGTAHRRNVSSVSYDPFLHLQAPPPVVGNDFAFGGGGVIQCSGIANQDFGNGLVEFTQDEEEWCALDFEGGYPKGVATTGTSCPLLEGVVVLYLIESLARQQIAITFQKPHGSKVMTL
ncbi:hypothetical protein VIGAN_UM109300 [Vigna angularis var. angularis]|uniref:Uncharacterized protein n=1 Tax=Vigna angularis var. angularis TaxID=157739 RepID=A0A0S3TED3_PHAAN|nr:hypothetical protein VIGAN_UM109300 [Vigna angularis var. angularis]